MWVHTHVILFSKVRAVSPNMPQTRKIFLSKLSTEFNSLVEQRIGTVEFTPRKMLEFTILSDETLPLPKRAGTVVRRCDTIIFRRV